MNLASGPFGWEDDMVKFTLHYRGPLHSDQADKSERKKRERHDIRRAFHDQLKDRWFRIRNLRLMADAGFKFPERKARDSVTNERVDHWWAYTVRGPYKTQYLPLVIRSTQISLVCQLDVRVFWRQPHQGGILQPSEGGLDLDNRLKGLLDALTIPQDNQLPSDTSTDPSPPSPFCCLLENDNLVTNLSIMAAPLTIPKPADEKDAYLEVTIDVGIESGELVNEFE